MANPDRPINRERRVGQGDRDVDPEMQRRRSEAEREGRPRENVMPDFVSGPGYTGEIPREGDSPEEGDWNAGSDVGRP